MNDQKSSELAQFGSTTLCPRCSSGNVDYIDYRAEKRTWFECCQCKWQASYTDTQLNESGFWQNIQAQRPVHISVVKPEVCSVCGSEWHTSESHGE